MAAPKLISAVVAPGRTVFAEGVSSKAWDADQKREIDVVKPGPARGPGETVSLPEGEVARLRKLGFLLVDGAATVITAPGPMFDVKEGPQIKVA